MGISRFTALIPDVSVEVPGPRSGSSTPETVAQRTERVRSRY